MTITALTLSSAAGNAWLIPFAALGTIVFGCGLLAWQTLAARRRAASAPVTAEKLAEAVALELDGEAEAILRIMRAYTEAGDRYSVCLAQAGKRLPSVATPEEVAIIVKFLIAENARMQSEAADLKTRLETSTTQIDKLRLTLAEAQEMGMRDPLTSLNNRRGFDVNLAKEITQAQSLGTALCLVMGDIDNFKKVNDAFGHPVGDEILKIFASVLEDNVQQTATVARYGGEEFAVILPSTELEDARRVAEQIRAELETKKLAVDKSGEEIGMITASFGIAQLSVGEDADKLVQRADAKLYEAKCAGRNRVAVAESSVAA